MTDFKNIPLHTTLIDFPIPIGAEPISLRAIKTVDDEFVAVIFRYPNGQLHTFTYHPDSKIVKEIIVPSLTLQ